MKPNMDHMDKLCLHCLSEKKKLWQISSYFCHRKEMFWGLTTLKAGNSRPISAKEEKQQEPVWRLRRSPAHMAVEIWPNSFFHFCTHQLGINSLHKHLSEGKLYIIMWFRNTSFIKGNNCQILSALGTEKSKYSVRAFLNWTNKRNCRH